jgi:hypothetical protein
MAVTKLFSEVTIGGNHSDNPPDYSWSNYKNYPGIDLTQTYQRIDIIVVDGQRTLQLTGLAFVVGGHAQTGPNDTCILPCPPYC